MKENQVNQEEPKAPGLSVEELEAIEADLDGFEDLE